MKTFLDIRERIHYRVPQENEEGFLGLAFHPKYKENGEFFVYYTGAYDRRDGPPQRDLAVPRRQGRPQRGRPGERRNPAGDSRQVLEPQRRHDRLRPGRLPLHRPGRRRPRRRSRSATARTSARCGARSCGSTSTTRTRASRTRFPRTTRSSARTGARGEIWCYGIRNVWRIAFDRETGDLWAGDVGQDLWEEIDIIRKGRQLRLEPPRRLPPVRPERQRRRATT